MYVEDLRYERLIFSEFISVQLRTSLYKHSNPNQPVLSN